MVLLIIRMKVLPEKRMELSQTIALLIGSIRTEKGCKSCDFCRSMEDENKLYLLGEWDTQENLKSHLKSGHFRVLKGAMNLLKEPYEMMFHPVFQLGETERSKLTMNLFNQMDQGGNRYEKEKYCDRLCCPCHAPCHLCGLWIDAQTGKHG